MAGTKALFCVLTAALAVVNAVPLHDADVQQPLAGVKSDLIHELKKADIIPALLDDFVPELSLVASWPNATTEVGNTISPDLAQKAPELQLVQRVPELALTADSHLFVKPGVQLTVALTDPDAPSREDPKWSQMCHWIATNVSLTDVDALHLPLHTDLVDGGQNDDIVHLAGKGLVTIMPYKPPGPPPKTGKHRYIFVALAPKNGTTKRLYLEKPSDRQFWGFGKKEKGVREWAQEMGLGIVGANFVYAQNKKQ